MTGPVEPVVEERGMETISRDDRRAAIAAAQGEVETGAPGDPECGSRHEGWFCVRRSGHAGLHVALAGPGPRDVLAVWPEPSRPVVSAARAQDEPDDLRARLRVAARVAFPGPDDTDADYLLGAAKKLEGGYQAGGSNVRDAVARVLRVVAEAVRDA